MRLALLAATAIVLANPLTAQCPDGAPPPCTRARVASGTVAHNSLAVRYFENGSRDTNDAYLADGLTEEITTRLGQVQRRGAIAP